MDGLVGCEDVISEVAFEPQPAGMRAVYLVETRSDAEANEVHTLFADLGSEARVRRLCDGRLVSYAVQARGSDPTLLDAVDDILRARYAFVVTQRSFDEVIYRIVQELARDTESTLLEMPACNICGKPEPFPTTVVSMSDEDGSLRVSRGYCATCSAGAARPSSKDFILGLLDADEVDFDRISQAELVRQPSRSKPVRFKVRL